MTDKYDGPFFSEIKRNRKVICGFRFSFKSGHLKEVKITKADKHC